MSNGSDIQSRSSPPHPGGNQRSPDEPPNVWAVIVIVMDLISFRDAVNEAVPALKGCSGIWDCLARVCNLPSIALIGGVVVLTINVVALYRWLRWLTSRRDPSDRSGILDQQPSPGAPQPSRRQVAGAIITAGAATKGHPAKARRKPKPPKPER